jgi:tetratricopeptide (TPR) repeat protein
VSVQSSKYLIAIMLTGVLGPVPVRMFGQGAAQGAAAPASAEPQKNWKDRAEYDLYDSITKDTNPKTRLEKLQQWEKQYPTTEWIDARRTLLLTTYAGLNDAKNAVEAAKQILAVNPKDFTALYYTMLFTIGLYSQNQTADVLDQGEKAAQAILASLDTPPPGVAADAWAKLRPDLELLANRNLGWIAMQRKSWDAAETQFQKTLSLSPNDAQVDYWMGTVIVQQKKVDKVPTAMFYFARAATYNTPPLALPADMQKTSLTYVQKLYKNYHGSDEGFNDLLALARSNATPPAGGVPIKNANEIAQAAAANEDEYNKAHPSEALWKNLKMTLTGPEGANYFMMMKGTEVPTLKGKVIKLEPPVKPKTVLLAMEDSSNNTTTADATLKFEMALAGKVEEGTELTFEGVADSYTANPFMVVFIGDPEKLHGWTGKNEPKAPVHRRPAAAAH